MMVRWPGHTPAGVVSEQQWAFYDFMVTAAALADYSGTLPENDGYNLVPTFNGQTQSQPPFIYHEYCEPNEKPNGWGQAVRMGEMSAVCLQPKPTGPADLPCQTPLLYNLTSDPSQRNNIASNHPNIVARMKEVMTAQHVTGHYCNGA
eukprot:m.44824 g.44824  ORF g.44824 m.44824 type:complete len:148 (+) comp5846_c0_seq1:2532-2975(+)